MMHLVSLWPPILLLAQDTGWEDRSLGLHRNAQQGTVPSRGFLPNATEKNPLSSSLSLCLQLPVSLHITHTRTRTHAHACTHTHTLEMEGKLALSEEMGWWEVEC
jgi:hypothetical protein